MFEQFGTFFSKYAHALENRHLEEIKSVYRLPFIVVHDEPKTVVSFTQELEENSKKVLQHFRDEQITEIKTEVQKAVHLNNDIYFANVNWTFKDEAGQIKLSYNSSYMLSVNVDDIKIITVIIDDKSDTYLKLI